MSPFINFKHYLLIFYYSRLDLALTTLAPFPPFSSSSQERYDKLQFNHYSALYYFDYIHIVHFWAKAMIFFSQTTFGLFLKVVAIDWLFNCLVFFCTQFFTGAPTDSIVCSFIYSTKIYWVTALCWAPF